MHIFSFKVINTYFELIVERSKQDGYPSIHAFNTFFYGKLKQQGYDSIKRWTRKIDLFSFDLVFVPIHLGVHWCLAVSYYNFFFSHSLSNIQLLLFCFKYLKKKGNFVSFILEISYDQDLIQCQPNQANLKYVSPLKHFGNSPNRDSPNEIVAKSFLLCCLHLKVIPHF